MHKEKTVEGLFNKIKNDLKKGLEGGIAVLKEGANVVSVKMNELSDEGKRQYKIFNLNLKIQDQIKELGGMAFAVLECGKSVDEDKKIKASYAKIKKLEWQLKKIEGGTKMETAVSRKTVPKTEATPQTSARKVAPKKTGKKTVSNRAAKK